MSKTKTIKMMLETHPDLPNDEVARVCGCTLRLVRKVRKDMGIARPRGVNRNAGTKTPYTPKPPKGKSTEKSLEQEYCGPNRNIVSTSSKIRTLEQLLKFCNVDEDKWYVKKHVVNSWGSEDNPCFQVKAWLSERTEKDIGPQRFSEQQIKEMNEHAPVYEPVPYVKQRKEHAGMTSIHDLHFGSHCWKPETGQSYDIKIAESVYMEAVYNLAAHLDQYRPSKIFFPVGSDFFNVNSKLNMTANGTFQDEDCRWQKTFIYGRRMVVRAVDVLRLIAPVHIPVVPGNHDEERAYYLGDSLLCWYRNAEDVTIDNSPITRKYLKWGANVLGLTHGNDEVKGTLPMIMMQEIPREWHLDARFFEWLTGHLHHQATKAYDYQTETNGVIERVLPSLAGTDSWHKKKGYSGMRSAEASLYHLEDGPVARFHYQPKDAMYG